MHILTDMYTHISISIHICIHTYVHIQIYLYIYTQPVIRQCFVVLWNFKSPSKIIHVTNSRQPVILSAAHRLSYLFIFSSHEFPVTNSLSQLISLYHVTFLIYCILFHFQFESRTRFLLLLLLLLLTAARRLSYLYYFIYFILFRIQVTKSLHPVSLPHCSPSYFTPVLLSKGHELHFRNSRQPESCSL